MWWPRKRPPANDDRFSVVIEEKHPTKRYRKGESRPESMEHCAVCLSRFQEGEAIRELRCSHVFHRDCVDKWLKQQQQHDHHLHLLVVHATCPLCRKSVFPEEMVVEHRRLQREQEISGEEEIVFISSALYGF